MRRLAAILLFLPGLALADVAGKPVVMDGDTMLFGEREITLYGVHAPLITQSCGASGKVWSCGWEAALHLERTIGEREVVCVAMPDAGEGGALARCRAAGEDLAGLMIDAGFAIPDAALGGDYAARAQAAAARGEGMWSGPFVDPVAWAEKGGCPCTARKQGMQETAAALAAMREAEEAAAE